MKRNSDMRMSNFIQGEEGYLFIGPNPADVALETALRAIEGALLCIGEGNTARAGQLLYEALPKDRKPVRS
jgi:hypothetical protein